jgi:hypothetical protein
VFEILYPFQLINGVSIIQNDILIRW